MNPDLRKVWGIQNITEDNINFCLRLITYSVLLAKDKCILPVNFVIQDEFSFIITRKISEYFKSDLISLPLKYNESFSSKAEKISIQYRNVRDNYSHLKESVKISDVIRYLDSLNHYRIGKNHNTGEYIANAFLNRLDLHDKYWSEVLCKYEPRHIDKLQKIPFQLHQNELAVTHGEIENSLDDRYFSNVDIHKLNIDIHKLVHYEYGRSYMEEYDSVSLYNFLGPSTFYPTNRTDNPAYDYRLIRNILLTLGIADCFDLLSTKQIIKLRLVSNEFNTFIDKYFDIAINYREPSSVSRFVQNVLSTDSRLAQQINKNIDLSGAELEKVETTCGLFNIAVSDFNVITSNLKPVTWSGINMKKIAIFVALKEEYEVLSDSLSLKLNQATGRYHNIIDNVVFEIYSPQKMGRVYAAIATYKYLIENVEKLPDMIIVAGIAGGFEVNGIRRGDILMPSSVYDVAITKKEGGTSLMPSYEVYRPEPFRTNKHFLDHISSPQFNIDHWCTIAKKESRRSDLDIKIHTKPMCCCDSVIKDEEWIDNILSVVHKEITGVDMETGGVCLALEELDFNKPILISVIRGVSDLSNPYKADDGWRSKAMYTVGAMIKSLKFTK